MFDDDTADDEPPQPQPVLPPFINLVVDTENEIVHDIGVIEGHGIDLVGRGAELGIDGPETADFAASLATNEIEDEMEAVFVGACGERARHHRIPDLGEVVFGVPEADAGEKAGFDAALHPMFLVLESLPITGQIGEIGLTGLP